MALNRWIAENELFPAQARRGVWQCLLLPFGTLGHYPSEHLAHPLEIF